MFKTLEVEVHDGIGQLWLNRPEKLNPLSRQTLQELAAAARWFDDNDEVRVVIVGGRGTSFSAGADISAFPTVGSAGASSHQLCEPRRVNNGNPADERLSGEHEVVVHDALSRLGIRPPKKNG